MSTQNVPTHVAIIPDGNRRWAQANAKSDVEGHRAGSSTFEAIATHAVETGIQHLSIWGLSKDNLVKRNPAELAALYKLFQDQFRKLQTSELVHSNKVRINVIGEWKESLPKPLQKVVQEAIHATSAYDTFFLNIFLAYNGTDEMMQAVRKIATQWQEKPSRTPKIVPGDIKAALYTHELPPVDFLIRTGGEPHLSAGFMMWDMADAELFFTEKLWPEFKTADFDQALADFTQRRRQGGA